MKSIFILLLVNTALAQMPEFTPSITITDPSPIGSYVTLSLPADVAVTNIKFDSSVNYLLAGPGKLVLEGGIDVASGNHDMISAPLLGDLTKTGDGTLVLDSMGSLNSVSVENGFLDFQTPMSISTLTVGAGATVIFDPAPEPGTLPLFAVFLGILFILFRIPLAFVR